MKHISNFINSDMLNTLLDKKLNTFSLFIVKDDFDKKLYLHFNDAVTGCEVRIAEFKSYKQFQRWMVEACIMRVSCSNEGIKKARQLYKKLFNFSRDPKRKDPFKE